MKLNRRKFLSAAASGIAVAGLGRLAWAQVVKKPPSVVLVLVDQLRKDTAHECLKRVLDKASGGIVFEQMRSVAPWTYPSVLSAVSGLLPYQHGANGHTTEEVLSTFNSEVPTLQKVFKAQGYATAGFITNPFLMDWNGFHEGFDHFDQGFIHGIGNQRQGKGAPFQTPRMYSSTVNEEVKKHWASRSVAGPEFTYLHYIDVHGPWLDKPPFERDYKKATEYLDARIMEMHEFFTARYKGDLVFLVTSDHGRAFDPDLGIGEKSPWRSTKKSVHEFNIRIPLMFLPTPALAVSARFVSEPCSNVDIFPTLMDLTGIKPEHELSGCSLVPAFSGQAIAPADRILYSDHAAFEHHNDCVIVNGKKHIRYFDPKTGDLTAARSFDLLADPDEALATESDPVVTEPLFAQATGRKLVYESHFDHLSENNRNDLRALGYLGK